MKQQTQTLAEVIDYIAIILVVIALLLYGLHSLTS